MITIVKSKRKYYRSLLTDALALIITITGLLFANDYFKWFDQQKLSIGIIAMVILRLRAYLGRRYVTQVKINPVETKIRFYYRFFLFGEDVDEYNFSDLQSEIKYLTATLHSKRRVSRINFLKKDIKVFCLGRREGFTEDDLRSLDEAINTAR